MARLSLCVCVGGGGPWPSARSAWPGALLLRVSLSPSVGSRTIDTPPKMAAGRSPEPVKMLRCEGDKKDFADVTKNCEMGDHPGSSGGAGGLRYSRTSW